MNPADKRLSELLEKWLTSLELHLRYSALDDASYWRVQPWVKHERPSRWIIELARQKALQLKEQLESRIGMGDARFSDTLELMGFLTNLVGSQHIERFIPLAEPQNEVDLKVASATQQAPAPAAAAAASTDSTRVSAMITQPRPAIRSPEVSGTREMPKAVIQSRPPPPKADVRRAARRESKTSTGSTSRQKADSRANSAEREQQVVGDAVRLLGWGRKWHELADLITRMADRPPAGEVRRILRDHKSKIEAESKPK